MTMLQLSNIAWEVNRELHLDANRWTDPGRPRSHEDVGTRVREGLGADSLKASR